MPRTSHARLVYIVLGFDRTNTIVIIIRTIIVIITNFGANLSLPMCGAAESTEPVLG